MRLLIFTLILAPLFCWGQNGVVQVKIKEKHNKLNRNTWEYAWIYNSDTSYKQNSSIHKRKAEFDSLPKDTYTVSIYSKYGSKLHQKGLIVSNSKKSITFDTKDTPFTYYRDTFPLVSLVSDSTVLRISWNMNGCFNWRSGWADIKIIDDRYFIKTYYNDSIYSQELSPDNIDYLLQIEFSGLTEEVYYICTNRYTYTFLLENKLYTFRRGCLDIVAKLLSKNDNPLNPK